MTIADIAHKTQRSVVDNSPAILAALGVGGVVSTAYLTGKGTLEAVEILENKHHVSLSSIPFRKEDVKSVWKRYIPAAISGVLTIGCILAGAKSASKKTTVAVSLLTVAQSGFDEYKAKVVETYGEKKEQAIHDEIVKDRLAKSPPPTTVIIGSGPVVCLEEYTGRYFMCDVETLKRAVNDVNQKMIKHNDATLSDFYYLVDLPITTNSGLVGWESNRLLELRFSTALTDDKRPCISFEYNYIIPF